MDSGQAIAQKRVFAKRGVTVYTGGGLSGIAGPGILF
jgi:hypothetical protein